MMVVGRRFLVAQLIGISIAWLSGCEYNQVRLEPATRELLKQQEKISVGYDSKFRFWAFDNPRCQYVMGGKYVPPSCRDKSEPVTYRNATDELKVDDPILKVRDHVIGLLETHLGLQNLRIRPPAINSGQLYDADLVLVVKNDSLTFMNGNLGNPSYPDGVRYSISYEAYGQLTRKADFKVLWQDRCSIYSPDVGIPKMSYGDLKANDWALLQEVMSRIADRCAEQMLASFLDQSRQN